MKPSPACRKRRRSAGSGTTANEMAVGTYDLLAGAGLKAAA